MEKLFDVPIGTDIDGKIHKLDLSNAGNMLIGGCTASGKTVFMQNLISNILKINSNHAKMVFVDFKNGIHFHKYIKTPHSLIDEVVKTNSQFFLLLDELIKEMDTRYDLILKNGCENLKEYISTGKISPHIFVFIDEFGEILLNCSKIEKMKIDKSLARLGQLSAKCGIHLIIAAQKPSKSIITNKLKENMATSIAFKTKNATDSKIIINVNGAESLQQRGQFIFSPSWGENIMLMGFYDERSN